MRKSARDIQELYQINIIVMENKEEKPTGKQIAEKYRYEAMQKLDRKQVLIAYKELHKLYIDQIADIEVYEARIEHLLKRIVEREKEISKENEIGVYNPKWIGIDKVIYILKKNSKVMLSSEILKELLITEPFLNQKWTNPYSAIITYIGRGVKFGRIVQHNKIGAFGYTYALPEWFDDEGNLFKQYRRK